MISIYPSLMGANLLNLEQDIKILDPHCTGFHLDLMDGHFVRNLALSPAMINAIDSISSHPTWVHIMAEDPLYWLSTLHLKNNSMVSIHIESGFNKEQFIYDMRSKSLLTSLAIKPKTPIEKLLPLLDHDIDNILLMTVEPGFCGQPFIPDVLNKIPTLIDVRAKNNLSFSIALDGGINAEALNTIKKFDVNAVAIASAIFSHEDRINGLKSLK